MGYRASHVLKSNSRIYSPTPIPCVYPIQTLRLHSLVGGGGNFRNSISFSGHTTAVARATYGVTTRLIYSCARDTTIRQWNRSESSALRVFEGHEMACTALALSAGIGTRLNSSSGTAVD